MSPGLARAILRFGKEAPLLRRVKRIIALALVLCLMLPMAGCGKIVGRYRIVETLGEQSYAIGFRNNDYVRYYVEAAIQTLAANGTISGIANRWFIEDNTYFAANANAMEQFEGIPWRTLLVGCDPDAYPLSYIDENGQYAGFDVELAQSVCALLGWQAQFIDVKSENAYDELMSGNVDCVWGGMTLDEDTKDFTVLTPYLTDELGIITRADTGAKSLRGLKGASLAISVEQKYMELLQSDEKLMSRFGEIKRLTGGLQALLEAVNTGGASAALVSSTAISRFGG